MALFTMFFRIIRKNIKHKPWFVQVEDVFYWLVVSLMMFYFVLQQNYAEIRFFVIIGAVLGTLLYFNSLSPLVIKVSVKIICFVQKMLFAVAWILLWPVRLLIK